MTKVAPKTYKFFKTKATSIDEANFTITFKISDGSVDREGEIVSQKDWKLDNYLANPIMLFGHDPSKPEYIIGQCVKIWYVAAEDAHYGTFKLDAEFNTTALLIWNQLVSGSLRTVSLGFINHNAVWQGDNKVLTDIEVLETSIAPIPANAGALAKLYKAASISKKDASWLVDTMRKEADAIEQQLTVTESTTKETKTMDEATTKQLGSLLDAVTALANSQETTNKRLDEVAASIHQKGAVADILNADSGWEVSDAKWDAMEDVSDIYSAFCAAYFYQATPVGDFKALLDETITLLGQVADGTYSDADDSGIVSKAVKDLDKPHVKAVVTGLLTKSVTETPEETAEREKKEAADKAEAEKQAAEDEAKRKADEDAKNKNGEGDSDLAKDGDNDQSGATDGDIDDDTEITPELQAEIDAELEAQLQAA